MKNNEVSVDPSQLKLAIQLRAEIVTEGDVQADVTPLLISVERLSFGTRGDEASLLRLLSGVERSDLCAVLVGDGAPRQSYIVGWTMVGRPSGVYVVQRVLVPESDVRTLITKIDRGSIYAIDFARLRACLSPIERVAA